MPRQDKRLFSVERNKLAQRQEGTTLVDVMDAIRSLENSVAKRISNHMENLNEKLDTAGEEDAKNPKKHILGPE